MTNLSKYLWTDITASLRSRESSYNMDQWQQSRFTEESHILLNNNEHRVQLYRIPIYTTEHILSPHQGSV